MLKEQAALQQRVGQGVHIKRVNLTILINKLAMKLKGFLPAADDYDECHDSDGYACYNNINNNNKNNTDLLLIVVLLVCELLFYGWKFTSHRSLTRAPTGSMSVLYVVLLLLLFLSCESFGRPFLFFPLFFFALFLFAHFIFKWFMLSINGQSLRQVRRKSGLVSTGSERANERAPIRWRIIEVIISNMAEGE